MLDLDTERYTRLPSITELKDVLVTSPPDWVGLTAVTPCYYDTWALRSSWCPFDLFSDTNSKQESNALEKKIMVKYDPSYPPIKVSSAFNGFAVYKGSHVSHSDAHYVGWDSTNQREVCEHVAFHKQLKEKFPAKNIYIVPKLRLGSKKEWNRSKCKLFPSQSKRFPTMLIPVITVAAIIVILGVILIVLFKQ